MFLNLTGLAAHSERKKNPVQLTATRCQPLMMLKVVSQKCEPPSLLPQSPLSLPLLHSIFFLSVPSHPLPPLSLSLNLRARYIKHPSTLRYTNTSVPTTAPPNPASENTPVLTWSVWTADTWPFLNELEKTPFFSRISGPSSSLFISPQVWQLITAQSEGDLFVCLQQLRKSRTVWHEERRSTKRHEDHMSVDCRRAAVSHLSGELNIILIWPFLKFSHCVISLWLMLAVFIKRHFYKWVSVKSSNKLELIILRSRCCLIVWPI